MYYEVYIDSLFILHFSLNLYLLLFVNDKLNHAVTGKRLIAGAVGGSAFYCVLFLWAGMHMLLLRAGGVLLWGIVLYLVFRPVCIRAFLKVTEDVILTCFLFGGAFLAVFENTNIFKNGKAPLLFILLLGAVLLCIFRENEYRKDMEKRKVVKVTLTGKDGNEIFVQALPDTGNSLVEPISGRPVSVIERAALGTLVDAEEGFRAIPYRSIGCERGILKGYRIPKLTLDDAGIKKEFEDVYIAVSEKPISASGTYSMLLHPALYRAKNNGKNRRAKNDIKGKYAGKSDL